MSRSKRLKLLRDVDQYNTKMGQHSMKMSRSKRLKILRELNPALLLGLSQDSVCAVPAHDLPTTHTRIMWMAGFRKGVKHTLSGSFTPEKGEARSRRGGPHVAWAKGYFQGKKFVPADVRHTAGGLA